MRYQLIAECNEGNVTQLGSYENQYQEGDRGYLDLQLRCTPPAYITHVLDDTLRISGLTEYTLEPYLNGLRIHFQKSTAPLVIIAIAIAGVILLLGTILTWKLYKLSPETVVKTAVLSTTAIIAMVLAAMAVIAIFSSIVVGRVRIGK